jgi:hypothetical protein
VAHDALFEFSDEPFLSLNGVKDQDSGNHSEDEEPEEERHQKLIRKDYNDVDDSGY